MNMYFRTLGKPQIANEGILNAIGFIFLCFPHFMKIYTQWYLRVSGQKTGNWRFIWKQNLVSIFLQMKTNQGRLIPSITKNSSDFIYLWDPHVSSLPWNYQWKDSFSDPKLLIHTKTLGWLHPHIQFPHPIGILEKIQQNPCLTQRRKGGKMGTKTKPALQTVTASQRGSPCYIRTALCRTRRGLWWVAPPASLLQYCMKSRNSRFAGDISQCLNVAIFPTLHAPACVNQEKCLRRSSSLCSFFEKACTLQFTFPTLHSLPIWSSSGPVWF